tara:strand:- start:517 stop:1887 length:1371 start_codon:yes stop_codon:yes gene_type:complete
MVLVINLLEFNKIKFFFSNNRKSLFFRLGLMVSVFAAILIIIIGLIVQLSYSEQDTILDAHEYYYYSQMVQSWGSPPDTNKVLLDIKNLHLNACIYLITDSDSLLYWKYPKDFNTSNYFSYSDSEYLGDYYNVEIPLYISFGDMNNIITTYAENENFRYFLSIDQIEPSAFQIKFIPASLLTLVFCSILFLFIKNYLQPIRLIRLRIMALEKGDLDSKIDVITNDELGSLTSTINKMIKNIKSLLTQKQQLLSEVSHELMSPLTRMQLLVELLPDHKNKLRLKNEIISLRNIISNLLLSDKLDAPYSNLNISSINFAHFLDKIIAKYPDPDSKIHVKESFPNINLSIDSLKVDIAIKNLIDNAFKYGDPNTSISISSKLSTSFVSISIHNFGKPISKKHLEKIKNPFYRINKDSSVKGFGLGLSITNKIITAHNGKLIIKSSKEEGTSFSLLFPIT